MDRRPFYRLYDPRPPEKPPPKTHLWYAVAALVVCFWPAGIVALAYALRARAKLREGDYEQAAHYSRLAKIWSWVALAIAVVIVIAVVATQGGGGGGTVTTLVPAHSLWPALG